MAMLRSLILLATAVFGSGNKLLDDGNPKDSNAVKMVIDMIEGLHDKVTAEGEAEEKTYTKFDLWCTDTKEEKNEEIKEGKADKTMYEGKEKRYTTEKGQEQDKIEAAETEISSLKKQIVKAKSDREAEFKAYQKTNAEFEHAEKAAGQAVKAIKDSFKAAAFFQQEEQVSRVRHLSLMADSLGVDSAKEALEFLDSMADGQEGDDRWTSGRDTVVSTLEDLEKDFRKKDEDSDMDDAKAETAYKMKLQGLEQNLAAEEGKLETAKEEKNDRIKRIAQAQEDLANTIKDLADNNKYLDETTELCAIKKATFEQRKATREEELKTLVKAKQIVSDAMAKKAGLISQAQVQSKDIFLTDVANHAANDASLLASAEAEAEQAEDETGVFSAPSFQQLSSHRHLRFGTFHRSEMPVHVQPPRPMAKENVQLIQKSATEHKLPKKQQELLEYLNEQAASIHSPRMVLLAQTAAGRGADPFKTIKDMITKMIDTLQSKAGASQDKKMTCDKNIGAAEDKRDKAFTKVKALNQQLMDEEARRDKLTEETTTLSGEMKKMDEEKDEATKLRDEESAENTASIEEAKTALSGVQQALKVLRTFYSDNAENKVEKPKAGLIAAPKGPAGDAPDAGFKNEEANAGSQAASKGIVGMLEVIESDFERTIRETEEEEAEATKKHKEFLNEYEISTAAKTKSKELKSAQKGKTDDEHSEDSSKLEVQRDVMKSAVLELVALEEECGAGAGYEARKANREAEIEAMKKAIDVITQMMNEK